MNITPLIAHSTAIHASIRQLSAAKFNVSIQTDPGPFQKMGRTKKNSFARLKNHSHHKKKACTQEIWLVPKKNRVHTEKMARTRKKPLSPGKNHSNAKKIIFTGEKSLVPVATGVSEGHAFSGSTRFVLISMGCINNFTKRLDQKSKLKNNPPNLLKQKRGTRSSKDEPP